MKERLLNNRKMVKDCWQWTGYKNKKGYGIISYKSKPKQIHRLSYEIYKGRIPKDLTIDHMCRNTLCFNPDHLEAVTLKENILRGFSYAAMNARKTHCNHGHEFSDKNTLNYFRKSKYGPRKVRECKACHLRREQDRRLRIGMLKKACTPIYK